MQGIVLLARHLAHKPGDAARLVHSNQKGIADINQEGCEIVIISSAATRTGDYNRRSGSGRGHERAGGLARCSNAEVNDRQRLTGTRCWDIVVDDTPRRTTEWTAFVTQIIGWPEGLRMAASFCARLRYEIVIMTKM